MEYDGICRLLCGCFIRHVDTKGHHRHFNSQNNAGTHLSYITKKKVLNFGITYEPFYFFRVYIYFFLSVNFRPYLFDLPFKYIE